MFIENKTSTILAALQPPLSPTRQRCIGCTAILNLCHFKLFLCPNQYHSRNICQVLYSVFQPKISCIDFFWNSFHSTPLHSPQATLHIIANVWSIFRPKIYSLPVLALNSSPPSPLPPNRPLYIFGIVVLLPPYPIILLVSPRKRWIPFFENEPQPILMCQLVAYEYW